MWVSCFAAIHSFLRWVLSALCFLLISQKHRKIFISIYILPKQTKTVAWDGINFKLPMIGYYIWIHFWAQNVTVIKIEINFYSRFLCVSLTQIMKALENKTDPFQFTCYVGSFGVFYLLQCFWLWNFKWIMRM